jgi:hypothetical protein
MANQNTISVQLTVKDDGSVVMKQFGKTTEDAMDKAANSSTKATSSFNTLKSSYLDMAAKAATAYMAIQKAMGYMDQGAKASQAEASFRTLANAAGESADKIIADMKRATNSTIDDSQLMQKATKAMMLDLTSDQATQIAEMARLAARTSGENVSTAFDNIVNAISTNMPRALKQYGLITKEQQGLVTQAMAEGVEDVGLFSIAWENYNKQLEKTGPLYEDNAERLQQYKAKIEDTKKTFGKFANDASGWLLTNISEGLRNYTATLAAITTRSSAPIDRWAAEKVGIEEAEAELDRYKARLANAQKMESGTESAAASLKASQQELAQRKADLETMKALDKDYSTSQEANIKAMEEIKKAAGVDDYKIASESLKKQEELNAEFYTRTKKEIEAEAAARSKADRDKISDAAFAAQKIQALDAETSSKATNLIRQRTLLSVQTAQNDISNLTSRLGEYQTYYDSLKAKMDKNIEDEKKHLEELKTLRQQSADLDKSTAALIAGIKGTDKSQSALSQYETGRSALNLQYGSALNLSGQDKIKALEEYKQAVAALQSQYAQGIPGVADIFGKAGDIISAKTILEDAISDIERAAQNQKNAIAELTAEQISADQLWGQVLQEEAIKGQGEIEKIKTLMADLSAQIQGMQKTIELTGIDNVSGVVNSITARIEALHTLAARPINIGGGGSYAASSGDYASGNTELYGSGWDTSSNWIQDSYATGTPYVPRTGIYQLHQGEAVIPAAENRTGKSVNINGDIIINVPDSAAANRPEDWRAITRNYIVPELRKLNS